MARVKIISITFEAEDTDEYERIMKWTRDQQSPLAAFFGYPAYTRVFLTCKKVT